MFHYRESELAKLNKRYQNRQFECIVIAVGDYCVSKKIVEDLKLYSIKKVVIVYYGVIDKYLGCKIYNHNCYIKQAEVGENVSIVVDDSSKLIIEDGVIIESGSILVADNSIIKIKSGTYIGKKIRCRTCFRAAAPVPCSCGCRHGREAAGSAHGWHPRSRRAGGRSTPQVRGRG